MTKTFVLIAKIDWQGSSLLGVFGNLLHAVEARKAIVEDGMFDGHFDEYAIFECEIGRLVSPYDHPVDVFRPDQHKPVKIPSRIKI